MQLKQYQRESLDTVARFCDLVRQSVHAGAHRPVHDAYHAACEREYHDVPQLSGTPYFCLRVPTGGGKTLIASHAVGAVSKHLGHQDRPLCLWVTPTTTIRDQTLAGLRDREHPYYEALRDSLGGEKIVVLTVEEALSMNRSITASAAVVIVTTIQSYRIDDEKNRRIYQDNGYLMDHFRDLPTWIRDQLAEPENGRVRLSLSNVMKLRGPIVVMDEAHNARTKISFDSLARFGPLAVLELTATPQQEESRKHGVYPSNVLHAVSALELKQEGMIKLPVELESRNDWIEVLALMVSRRNDLEKRAQQFQAESGRYIRPIALIQAQPKSKSRETHTIEAVKTALVERLKVPKEYVRDHDEIGDEDLRDEKCEVRYIVTVEKLREGWDCPFAYVLGSVGNVATETAVEQLLGRVLRMPHARPTGVAELDRAYAIAQSPDVLKTAKDLRDNLVNCCGFDEETVNDSLRVRRIDDPQGRLPLLSIPVSKPPDMKRLPPAVQAKVQYDPKTESVHFQEQLSREETLQFRDSLPEVDHATVEEYWLLEREPGTAAKKLDQYADPVRVPQMIVRDGKRSWLFEPQELDEYAWNLDKCDVKTTESEFSPEITLGARVALEVDGKGGIHVGGVEEVMSRQLTFWSEDDWDREELVRWLDREVHGGGAMAGLPQSASQAWLWKFVEYLQKKRGCDLGILVRKRHQLSSLARTRLSDHGREQVQVAAKMLFDSREKRRLETSMDAAKVLEEQCYSILNPYKGAYSFQKHAFSLIDHMGDEESRCAKVIDDHPNVKRWLRNLDRKNTGGFSLPLSPGRFFPDFIAELNDGRVAVIEYKGKHLAKNDDSECKEEIGNLWAARSNGQCVFVWVADKDWAGLKKKLVAR